MDISLILFCFFAFLSFFSATFAGFGGIIIALTLGVHLYPIKWMLPVLLPLNVAVNLYIFLQHHRYIDNMILINRILPFIGIGLVIGFATFNFLHGELLRTVFGIIVILISFRELNNLIRVGRQNKTTISNWISTSYVFMSGVIHGIYASGGPLLVYAVNKMQLSKSVFRSTVSIVWLIMNICLTGAYAISGKIGIESLKYSAYLLPSLFLGIVLGEFLHQRIPERIFKIAVFLLLVLSGIFITLK